MGKKKSSITDIEVCSILVSTKIPKDEKASEPDTSVIYNQLRIINFQLDTGLARIYGNMKITKRQLRQIIRESIEQQLYVIPDHQLKKLYQYYTGRKSDHLQAISLADAYKIDHAGLIGQIMDWLNKGGHLNADSDGYEFAYIMGYNFMKFYGDDHPVDEYAFAPYEREFEEGAYEYLVDEYRKTDPGPQGFDEDMPRGERIIEEGIIHDA